MSSWRNIRLSVLKYSALFLLSLNAERAFAEALLMEWTEETLLFIRKEVLS
jgi:hypothetical protein